jgi:DNA-binding NarL/FixJ family response regulator
MAEANKTYGSALVTNAHLLLEMVSRLEDGEDVVEIVRSSPGGPGRSAARDAAKALENRRFRFRSAMVSACVERGMARKEIARSLGCSPQLVSRYLDSAQGPN